MRKILVTIFTFLYTTSLYAQRYTGYGRGADLEEEAINYDSPSSSFYKFFFLIAGVIIIIVVLFAIFDKIKKWKGLKSGEYIKIVANGHIEITNNKYNKHLEVVKTWKIKEFESQYGKFSYKTKKVNIAHTHLKQIICANNQEEKIIYVPFDCESQDFFQQFDKYKIAQTSIGSYVLYR